MTTTTAAIRPVATETLACSLREFFVTAFSEKSELTEIALKTAFKCTEHKHSKWNRTPTESGSVRLRTSSLKVPYSLPLQFGFGASEVTVEQSSKCTEVTGSSLEISTTHRLSGSILSECFEIETRVLAERVDDLLTRLSITSQLNYRQFTIFYSLVDSQANKLIENYYTEWLSLLRKQVETLRSDSLAIDLSTLKKTKPSNDVLQKIPSEIQRLKPSKKRVGLALVLDDGLPSRGFVVTRTKLLIQNETTSSSNTSIASSPTSSPPVSPRASEPKSFASSFASSITFPLGRFVPSTSAFNSVPTLAVARPWLQTLFSSFVSMMSWSNFAKASASYIAPSITKAAISSNATSTVVSLSTSPLLWLSCPVWCSVGTLVAISAASIILLVENKNFSNL